ncbi:hypothetical protein [Spiroplasma clarkii]|uniref:Uncharacterized protein n=1 Tax=Spiroplasma clarkii TaxID=2139 RepID=A0A2K8KM23_9MOLU|nr:hypothetical protein [Spiroplasma clarkii]ATX70584.1 hypothetical protein SCLAR_v1c02540 [Spiroplasma clarkii]
MKWIFENKALFYFKWSKSFVWIISLRWIYSLYKISAGQMEQVYKQVTNFLITFYQQKYLLDCYIN